MRLIQWLTLFFLLPQFSKLAKTVESLSFQERFVILQKACANLLIKLRVDLDVKVSSHIDPTQVYYLVSNHQATFDPILLVKAAPMPHSFISKVENLKLPVIGEWGQLIEFITFNRDDYAENVSMLRQASRFLKDGKSLLVFPEGTRSRSNTLSPFKSGSLLPAYLAKVAILPVAMHNAYTLKHSKKITITYGDPLPYPVYKDLSYDDLSQKLFGLIEALKDDAA